MTTEPPAPPSDSPAPPPRVDDPVLREILASVPRTPVGVYLKVMLGELPLRSPLPRTLIPARPEPRRAMHKARPARAGPHTLRNSASES